MAKHEAPGLAEDGGLPRPIVLRPEDLASVAAGAIVAMPGSALLKLTIAGGFPIGPLGPLGSLGSVGSLATM